MQDTNYIYAKTKIQVEHNMSLMSEDEEFSVPLLELAEGHNLENHRRTIIHIDVDCFYAQVCIGVIKKVWKV